MIHRKKSNLKATQDANEVRRIKLIHEALVALHYEKASYPDVTSLAKRVGQVVTLREVTDPTVKKPGISYTTLLRNTRSGTPNPYRLQLNMFQDGTFNPAQAQKELTNMDIEDYIRRHPALRAYIATKDLEIANLKNASEEDQRDMKRLKTHLQAGPQATAQISDGFGQLKLNELKQAKLDLTLTCTWIERFLRELEWVEIDEENEVVLNKAKRGNPPIAEKNLFAPFFKALKISRQGRGQNE